MQLYHSHGLPPQSAAAGQGVPQLGLSSTTSLPAQLLQQLRGCSHACNRIGLRRTVVQQSRLCSTVRTASLASSMMGMSAINSNALQKHLILPHTKQPCRMAMLRATLTSDAATRKHLPQHLQDANARKQASPRSNASSSAVVQAREGVGGGGYSQSQQMAEAPQQRQGAPQLPSSYREELAGTAVEAETQHASSSGVKESGSLDEQVELHAIPARCPHGHVEGHASLSVLLCIPRKVCSILSPSNDSDSELMQVMYVQVQKLEGALAVASASVEGTIQNVTYKDEKSGYTVLKVAALHTAGEPPEQRINAAQQQTRKSNGSHFCQICHPLVLPEMHGGHCRSLSLQRPPRSDAGMFLL